MLREQLSQQEEKLRDHSDRRRHEPAPVSEPGPIHGDGRSLHSEGATSSSKNVNGGEYGSLLVQHGNSKDVKDEKLLHLENATNGNDENPDDEDDGEEYDLSSSEDDDDDDEDSEISYEDSSADEDEDEEQALLKGQGRKRRGKAHKKKACCFNMECKMLQPFLNLILQLYHLIRDAVILVTNTDDVWDSPAYDTRDQNGRIGNVRSNFDNGTHSIHSASSNSTSIRYRQLDQNNRRTLTMTTLEAPSLSGERHVSLRHKFGVLFWFLILAAFYALERCSFKIMVDRMGPFRMVVGGEMVVVLHAFITGTWLMMRWMLQIRNRKKTVAVTNVMSMLPLADVGLMAVLDTVQLLLSAISASHVAPILTAILVHVTIPFSTLINYFTRPKPKLESNEEENEGDANITLNRNPSANTLDGNQSASQLFFGATLIMLSSILALSPAVLTLVAPTIFSSKDLMADRTAMNTILFVMSYIPGAISQSYKEHTLATYAQPVDPDLLNCVLSIFSAIIAFVVSPIFYPLQGLADMPSMPGDEQDLHVKNWIHQYPSNGVSKNWKDGFQCFTGTLSDEVQIREYPEQAHCDFAYGFVLLHVFSVIAISHAIGKICSAGAFKIMHRGISAGIVSGVVALIVYQVFVDDVDYGVLPNVYHMICAVVLVMGSEVYHRVTLENSFETEYPPVNIMYEDE